MTGIKPSDHGIVVDHKDLEIRYAVSDRNYNERIHHKVRDLRPGETVQGFSPRPKGSLGDQASQTPETGAAGEPADGSATSAETTNEGSPSGDASE